MNPYSDESPLLGDVSFNSTPVEDAFAEKIGRRASLAEELGLPRNANSLRFGRSSRRARALAVVLLAGAILFIVRTSQLPGRRRGTGKGLFVFDRMTVLNSPQPMTTFNRQLKKGVRYATTLSFGGHTNQFQSIVNLLKFAKESNRVAIIPNLYPLHINVATTEKFSTFYNISLLYHQIRQSLLEAKDFGPFVPLTLQQEQDLDEMGVNDESTEDEEEELSCWSSAYASTGMWNSVPTAFGLTPSYYPLPPIEFAFEEFLEYESLAKFDLNTTAKGAWIESVEKSRVEGQDWKEVAKAGAKEVAGIKLGKQQPKEQVVCFDQMFFMGTKRLDPNVRRPYDGAGWKEIGQFIRFTNVVEQHVDDYLLRLFGVESMEEVPKYIGMHVRRGDFAQARSLIPLQHYIDSLSTLKTRLRARDKKPAKFPIVVTTDELPSSAFFKALQAMGWLVMNHEAMRTDELLGGWYTGVVDAGILSRGVGFVGTEWSSFSFYAGLRVKYWNGGLEEFADFDRTAEM